MEKDLKFINALNLIKGLGSQKMKTLISFFGSAEKAWYAQTTDLLSAGIGEKLAESIVKERKEINPDKEWEKLVKENIQITIIDDEKYPLYLKEIPSAPYLLYYKSAQTDYNFNSAPLLTIVGSRKFTSYGRQATEKFASELARAGLTIISGLALGIDSFAHRSALHAGGKTIAVLASDLEDKNIGPRSNYALAQDIIQNGALVSHFPLGTIPAPGNFPARNRLMAGMAMGTLIVEAARESGSLITAALALEFNREVFSVPGPIFSPQSEGTNELIKKGAKIVTTIKDVLEELRIEEKQIISQAKQILPESAEEERIMSFLSFEPLHIDTISKLTKLEASIVSSTLAVMEIKGMVKNIGGQNYVRL